MRGATGTRLTPRHAREAAVLLMAERVGACQQQHAAESTVVSHHSTQTQRHSPDTHTHTTMCAHTAIHSPASLVLRFSNVRCWESNSYATNLISCSVEVHFHLIQTTACIAKGNYISTASVCPQVVDSQSKPRQVFLPLYSLTEINRTVPRLIHDLSQ